MDSAGGGGTPPPDLHPGTYVVLAANDLGMHCVDRETSVFSILPLFNVIQAQVVQRSDAGLPALLTGASVDVTFEAVADPMGSVNSRSLSGKTDFWDHVQALFGANVTPGVGLTGLSMPADAAAPGPQPFAYEAARHAFLAFGIPLTPMDDAGRTNSYPLLRISARDPGTGASLASLDVVAPVSDETDCRSCHATGAIGTRSGGITWSATADPEVQAKENVLLLHDKNHGTTLSLQTPVLCARCHYSPPLDLAGDGPTGPQAALPWFSAAMHGRHGALLDGTGGPLFPPGGSADETCYRCHPGLQTDCQRGAMRTGGMACYDCHGDMRDVGGEDPLAAGGSLDGQADGASRRSWTDLPRCQSCHTGDAVARLGGTGLVPAPDGIRLRQAWRNGDPAASPILASNKRFAEADGQLYRQSRGHGGLLCTACHGSPHAIWPIADAGANDNVAAVQLQGHAGTLSDCGVCHVPGTLGPTTNGPHGMHNVGDPAWYDHRHEHYFEADPDGCRACHGQDLRGTALSRAAADRSFLADGRRVNIPEGTPVGCNLCHEMPGRDD